MASGEKIVSGDYDRKTPGWLSIEKINTWTNREKAPLIKVV